MNIIKYLSKKIPNFTFEESMEDSPFFLLTPLAEYLKIQLEQEEIEKVKEFVELLEHLNK